MFFFPPFHTLCKHARRKMAGIGEENRLTLERISQMRATLADGFKALKKAYADANLPAGGTEERKKANVLVKAVTKNVEDVINEYHASTIDTKFEENAADELLSELKVYKENLENKFRLFPDPEASPINRPPGVPTTSVGRLQPSLPVEQQVNTDSESTRDDPNRTKRVLNMSEETRSKASSFSGSKKTGSGSARSKRSSQATEERDKEVEKEQARREMDKMNHEVQMEELKRQMAELQRKEQLEERLSEMKIKSINNLHDQQQILIDLEDDEKDGEEERKELEKVVGGPILEKADQKSRVVDWAATAGENPQQTSTAKKEAVDSRKMDTKKLAKPKTENGKREEVEKKAKRLTKEVETLTRQLEEKKREMEEQLKRERRARTEEAELVGPERGGMSAWEKLMEIQAKMWAVSHLHEIRPVAKYSGGKKVDFAKQMKLVETAFETPGLSSRQKLQELRHYFAGSAFELIEADTLRKDSTAALEDALEKLRLKFGVRQETATEMLEGMLVGKAIGEKDNDAFLMFYAKLTSVYQLAQETGRAQDFEGRTVVEIILYKKLPFLQRRWCKKAVRYTAATKMDLGFADFLEFLNEEHAVAEMMTRSTANAQAAQRTTQMAKVAATSAEKAGSKPAEKDVCGMCKANHPLTACTAFRNASAEEKRRVCISGRICYRCLMPGHGARFCKEGGSCSSCGQSGHHALVHALFPPSPPAGAAAAGGAVGGNPA